MNEGNPVAPAPEEPAVVSELRAWQPFTPRGIAAFASASWSRLLVVQLVVGLLAGLTVALFLHLAWFPPIKQAIRQLPAQGEISSGRLQWTNVPVCTLAANRFLTIAVDPDHSGTLGLATDLQVEFGLTEVRLAGMLGAIAVPYPKDQALAFNQRELVPWWGAWSQAIATGAVMGTALGLLLIWILLATLYAPLAATLGRLSNRQLSAGGAWRLAGASLMPGAALFTLAIFLYSTGFLDLVRLGFVAVFHLIVAWIYLPISVLCRPREATKELPKANPFANPPAEAPAPKQGDNPFES